MKKSQTVGQFGTFKQSFTFGFGVELMHRVPFGNNAGYLQIVFHKLLRLFIYAKIFRFSQLKTPRRTD